MASSQAFSGEGFRISEFDASTYIQLCTELNKPNPGKDYKTLAGRMEYAIGETRAFQLEKSPSDALLSHWGFQSENDLKKLVGILKEMRRDDLVDMLLKQASTSQRRNGRKRKHQATLKLPNTWTHLFVCLGKTVDGETPNQDYKKKLVAAGLGEKKIVFQKNSSCSYFYETLLESFPRLRDGGGFELLCTQRRSTTRLEILCPRQGAGYNVFHLEEDIPSAKIYVRPLQRDLNLEPLEPTDIAKTPNIGPLEKCINCQEEVPLFSFRQHMAGCLGGPSRSGGGQIDVSERSGEKTVSSVELSTASIDRTAGPLSGESRGLNSGLRGVTDDNIANNVKVLKEMFPNIPEEDLKDALQDNLLHIEETIEQLLEKAPGGETEKNIVGDSPEELLRTISPSAANAPQRISISRDHLLNDSIRFFKKREFDFKSPVRVVFEGEPAVDGGGPKREYFTLLLQSLISPSSSIRLFEGRNSFILPMHNMDAIRAGLFKVAGRMITTSVINGGPGFPVLSPVLYRYLTSPTEEIDNVITEITKDVVDWNILQSIEKIDAATDRDIEHVSSEVQHLLVDSGYTKVLNMSNKLEAITALCVHSVILSRKGEIDQFALGLKPLLKLAKENPESMKHIFVAGASTLELNAETFKDLLLFEEIDVIVKDMFLRYIDTEAEKLPALLMFCTGTNQIPPLGFHEPSKITVMQLDAMSGQLPNANTCPQELQLPSVHAEYEAFRESINCALVNQSSGFGIV